MLTIEETKNNYNYTFDIPPEKLKELRYDNCNYISLFTKNLNTY